MQNILIVDDDRVFLGLMARFLEKRGYRAVTAEDGLAALDALESFSPDLIFIDLIMPNIDGKTLYRIIRGMEKAKSAYIVMLSAVSAETRPDLEALGVDAFIAKGPFDELSEHLTAVLEQPEEVARRCAAGEILGIPGIDNRRIKQELLSAKKHFEAIVNKVSDGIFEFNSEGRVVLANKAGLAMLDMPEEKVLGSQLTDLFTGEAQARVRDLIEKAEPGAAGTPSRLPLRFNRYLLEADVISPGAERPNRMLILHDITAVEQSENILKRFNAELEKRVRERTAVLETANRFKSEFVAHVSHELRTPMNGVLGACDLALREKPGQKIREYLEMIQSSAINLLYLINDILDFSAIESGRIRFETNQFSLRETVERIYDVFHDMIQEKNLEFAVDIPEEVPDQLMGDALRLRQVIINLLGNAFKFTDCGEIVLHVGLQQLTGQEVELRFSVTDTGGGIEPDKIATLFEAFVQADNSHRAQSGTGLGLAISKKLVEHMGGTIDVQSTPGKGSTFAFTAHFGIAVESASEKQKPGQRQDLEGLNALIVDDHDVAREALGMLVASLGCLVKLVATPQEALALCKDAIRRNQQVDLIVLDHNMVEMNGVELAARIGALNWPGNAPVRVMISGYTSSIDRAAARKAGIRKILSKPIKRSRLSDELSELYTVGQPRQTTTAAKAGDSEGDFTGKRALLVEDNPINQKVAAGLLQSVNFEVVTADDGDEALDILEKATFDVILMDVQMPRMDGYEATRRIRTRPGFESLPIIAMTADVTAAAREKCLAAGMDHYASKPIDRARLLALLKRLLEPSA